MRYLLFFLLIYLIYKGIKYLIKLFLSTGEQGKEFTNQKSGRPEKSSVNKKDIIDAEFEDIDESAKTK